MERPLASLPAIETKRLHLRPLLRGDAETFREMTDEPAITEAIHFLSTPFTLRDAEALIAGTGDGRDCFWGVWHDDDPHLIGTVGAHLHGATEIEIGYWFATAAQGHGFATEAVAAMVTALVSAYPARRLIAECRPDNRRSWHLLTRIGFQPDGGDGLRAGRKKLVFSVTERIGPSAHCQA